MITFHFQVVVQWFKSCHNITPNSGCEKQLDVHRFFSMHNIRWLHISKLHWIVMFKGLINQWWKRWLKHALENCTVINTDHLSCTDTFLVGWLRKSCLQTNFEAGDLKDYLSVLDEHLKPTFGDLQLPCEWIWPSDIDVSISLSSRKSLAGKNRVYCSPWLIMENLLITPGTALSFLIWSASLTISATKLSNDYPTCFSIN